MKKVGRTMVGRTCKECGIEFMVIATDAARGKGLYCSNKCRYPAAGRVRKARRMANIGDWFWQRVDQSGGPNACWPWSGMRYPAGYGRFKLGKRYIIAHRTAYFLTYDIDPGESVVCHHCDNPPCCNPRHLFLGDHSANMLDRQQKGQYLSGENHPLARLSQQDVIAIKARLAAGETALEVSRDYPVYTSTISSIRDGKTWKAVGGESHV